MKFLEKLKGSGKRSIRAASPPVIPAEHRTATDADTDPTIASASATFAKICNKMAPLPPDEQERIQKLLSYNILDSVAETAFDELTELASNICGTPIALVSLIDKDRQWFKSRVGLEPTETARDAAFCSYAILDKDKVMVVPDALQDERFAHNELVLGAPNIRFYAGAPIVTPDGFALGTLCAIDTVPREFDASKQRALQILSHQVVAQLETRQKVEEMKKTIVHLQELEHNLRVAKEVAESSSISSFENLLLSQAGIQAFQAFLQEEFCAENLELWLDIKAFREAYGKVPAEDSAQEARRIIETYVGQGTAKQANLSSDVASDLHTLLRTGKVDINMFENARKEAFENMKRDSYQRFLSSKQYRDLTTVVRHLGFVRMAAGGA